MPAQRTCQRVLVLLGELLDGGGLFEHALGLGDDLRAQRRDGNLGAAAFKQDHAQFIFQFLDGDRQRRLGDVTGLGRMSEVLRPGHGNNVFQFGQCHKYI